MKKNVPVRLDPELHERAMRLVYWTPGLSFNKLVTLLLDAYIEQEEHVRGAPFPERNQWDA